MPHDLNRTGNEYSRLQLEGDAEEYGQQRPVALLPEPQARRQSRHDHNARRPADAVRDREEHEDRKQAEQDADAGAPKPLDETVSADRYHQQAGMDPGLGDDWHRQVDGADREVAEPMQCSIAGPRPNAFAPPPSPPCDIEHTDDGTPDQIRSPSSRNATAVDAAHVAR